jgi:hypothetical protein
MRLNHGNLTLPRRTPDGTNHAMLSILDPRPWMPATMRSRSLEVRTIASHLNRWLLRSAYLACVVLLLRTVGRSWHPDYQLTSTIHFGSKFEERSLDALKRVPHAVLPESHGYDGQFYAQLALSPALADPQLPRALDNVAYRSRRILFSWTAWLLGCGRGKLVVRAYAVQNTLFWLANAVLLLHWLPPTRWFHFARWSGILFSAGWLDSISNAVLDGPALFVLLLALWLVQQGAPVWGTALVGISGLGKETNLLAGFATSRRPGMDRPTWAHLLLRAALLVVPVAAWLMVIHFRYGLAGSGGSRNFTLPLLGWISKCHEFVSDSRNHGWHIWHTFALGCAIAVIVQSVFFLSRWKRTCEWWRMGLPYALLALCLGTAVLEGWPGAFTRALLPLTAAFNLSLTANWRGWSLLLLGNLHVFAGLNALGIKLPFLT